MFGSPDDKEGPLFLRHPQRNLRVNQRPERLNSSIANFLPKGVGMLGPAIIQILKMFRFTK